MRRKTIQGHVVYTGRALRMDASEAMGRDIIRAIIEAVTNSDDSYARIGKPGKIWIGVDHSRKSSTWKLMVRDRAGALGHQEMLKGLTHIGERTSGFESGVPVRGNRGRGAKDLIAFGEVIFESIKDSRYCQLLLRPDGSYEADAERSATKQDRGRLHIPRGSGTSVTLDVQRAFTCPRHERLSEEIARDFQLRDIMADPDREVLLTKLNDPTAPAERLRYEVDRQRVTKLHVAEVDIKGYEHAPPVGIEIYKLPERCDASPSDRTRPCGFLLKGRRATYDNTLFGFEGMPYAGWMAGRIECPYIDQLAREYDDRDERREPHPAANPIPIISRRRQGLAAEHPFTKALTVAVEELLRPIVDKLEEEDRARSRELESSETRQQLDRLGKEAARLMQESLRELDEEDDRGVISGALDDIKIIPQMLYVPLGETRTLSIICDRSGLSEGDEVLLEAEPPGVIEVAEGSLIALGPHRDRRDGLSARAHIKALASEEAIITAHVNGRSDASLVRGIVPEPPQDPESPSRLEFERERFKIGFGKKKTIEVRAPSEVVGANGADLALRSTDEGIVLRRSKATLELDPDLGWYTLGVRIEGRALGARGRVIAELGLESAECRVTVVERDDGLPDLRIELSDEEPGAYRAYFDPPDPGPDGSQSLRVLIRHPAIKLILGEDLAGEQTREWKAVLAEVVTDAMVRRLMTRRYPVSEEVDAQTLYRDHVQWLAKLLPKVQRVLMPSSARSLAARV